MPEMCTRVRSLGCRLSTNRRSRPARTATGSLTPPPEPSTSTVLRLDTSVAASSAVHSRGGISVCLGVIAAQGERSGAPSGADVHRLELGELLEPGLTHLAADAALLVAAERHHRRRVDGRVDVDRAALELLDHGERRVD